MEENNLEYIQDDEEIVAEEPVPQGLSRRAKVLTFLAVFSLSFMVFVVLTFPYGIIKDVITSQVSQSTGFTLQIEKLKPIFPFGFLAKNIRMVGKNSSDEIILQETEIDISILSLLIGRLKPTIEIQDAKKGRLEVSVSIKYFGLLFSGGDQVKALHNIDVEAKNFFTDQLTRFALTQFVVDMLPPNYKTLVASEVEKVNLSGSLDGKIEVDFDHDNPKNTEGVVDLTLKNAALKLNDKNLKSLEQEFTKALIKGKIEGGRLQLAENSGLASDELQVDLNGRITLAQAIQNSNADLQVGLKMLGELNKQYGFLLDLQGGTPRNGEQSWKITGALSAPNVVSY